MSFHTLLVGGNPMTTSAIYALIHKLERDGGVWFAKGGTNRLVAGMVAPVRAARRRRSGWTIRSVAIEVDGDRVTGGPHPSGWRGAADAVATNGDIVHSYGPDRGPSRGPEQVKRAQAQALFARRCSWSISGSRAPCPTSRTT